MKVIVGGWVETFAGGLRVRLSSPDACLWCERPTTGGERFLRGDGTVAEVAECARCWIERERNYALQVIDGGQAA